MIRATASPSARPVRPSVITETAPVPVTAAYRLDRTVTSGQCFRWTLTPGGARGVVDGTVSVVRQMPEGLAIAWEGPEQPPEHLVRHLGADQPLVQIEAALAADPVIRRLLAYTSGIAIMRQDPWECLVSYVISAFNNIPKIQLSVRKLSERFGEPIARTTGEWTFPPPERLADATLRDLRACALGYRARYVREIARLVADRRIDLGAVASMPFGEARDALLALPGVGEKVADCVLLFGLGRREAFPVDVWVQRAVERWYFGGRSRTPRAIRAWAADRFGALAGYAQQHLFAGVRRQGLGR